MGKIVEIQIYFRVKLSKFDPNWHLPIRHVKVYFIGLLFGFTMDIV